MTGGDLGRFIRRWIGADRRAAGRIVVWRVSAAATATANLVPIMRVGRRPYRAGRLANRLEAIRGMELTPGWMPSALRMFMALVVITAVAGLALPVPARRVHVPIAGAALVVTIVVLRAAGRADLTTATPQLALVAVTLAVTMAAAALPVGNKSLA